MIILKINIATTRDYCSQTLKSKLKMSIKILATIKNCLILVIIRLSQDTTIIQTSHPLVK